MCWRLAEDRHSEKRGTRSAGASAAEDLQAAWAGERDVMTVTPATTLDTLRMTFVEKAR